MGEGRSSPAPGARRWKHYHLGSGSGKRPVSHRRRNIVLVSGAILLLAGIVFTLARYFHVYRGPALRTVTVTEYGDPHFPANSMAVQDGRALAPFFLAVDESLARQERSQLLAHFRDFGSLRAGQPLVIYLAAYAISTPQGVYVLPADASPDVPKSWVSMTELLDGLRACGAPHKLLILDLMKPMADPRLGRLSNDIAGRLRPTLEKAVAADPSLWILSACSPGQVSLVSEEMGQSVFAFYLAEGLRGRADGCLEEARPDRNLSVRELARFVTARVDRWAERNRQTRQTPFLLGKGDYTVRSLEGGQDQSEQEAPPAPSGAMPEWLSRAWQLRDQARTADTTPPTPRALRRLEDAILQAEQRWRGRMKEQEVRQGLDEAVRELRQQLVAAGASRPRLHSLALEESLNRVPVDEAAANDLRALLARFDGPTLPEPKEVQAEIKKFLAHFDSAAPAEKAAPSGKPAAAGAEKAPAAKAEPEKPAASENTPAGEKPPPAVAAGVTVWEVAAAEPSLRAQKLQTLNQIVQALPERGHEYAEPLYLQRLAGLAADSSRQVSPELASVAVQAFRETERAVALVAAEPRLLPWVQASLDAISTDRRKAEGLLFGDAPQGPGQAQPLLEEVRRRVRDQVNRPAEQLRQAFRVLEESWHFLPADLAYVARPTADETEDRDYLDAVARAVALAGYLSATPPTDADAVRTQAELVEKEADALNARLQSLKDPFSKQHVKEWQEVDPASEQAAMALVRVDSILRTPFPTTEDRAALWEARRKLAVHLHEQTRKADEADDSSQPPRVVLKPFAEKPARQDARRRALRLARLSLGELRLGGMDDEVLRKLEAVLSRTESDPSEDAADDLAEQLRQVWAGVADRIHQQLERGDERGADRLSRILHAYDRQGVSALDEPATNPTVQLRAQQAKACWGWLHQRCQQEADAIGEASTFGRFYHRAAAEYGG